MQTDINGATACVSFTVEEANPNDLAMVECQTAIFQWKDDSVPTTESDGVVFEVASTYDRISGCEGCAG